MENKGLLFIPDISGFSRFINETEIEHSRLIIQELLETLINANRIGLEISEIEGDAILFYRFGQPPDLDELYKQVETMFCAFHKSLIAYNYTRYCQCTACMSAINLTLKVITHYGEFTGYNVKSYNKLIGKDIITAHQLLKNDIDHHEYWLITKNLLRDRPPENLTQWMAWNDSVKKTENGEIPFQYTPLSKLKEAIEPDPLPQLGLTKKVKILSFSKAYETDIITLFHATGDFNYRSRWWEGVKRVEEINHFLPRIGTRCRCILENGEEMTYASSYYYQPDRIEFSETDEKKNKSTYFTLEQLTPKKTKLTIDYYLPKNLLRQIQFALTEKNKLEKTLLHSIENLVDLVKAIKLPGIAHDVDDKRLTDK